MDSMYFTHSPEVCHGKGQATFFCFFQDEEPLRRILNLYLLLNIFSFAYGIAMGSYHSVFQAFIAASNTGASKWESEIVEDRYHDAGGSCSVP